jgi:hypothetical protein
LGGRTARTGRREDPSARAGTGLKRKKCSQGGHKQ